MSENGRRLWSHHLGERERETSVIIEYKNTLGNQDRIGKIK